MSKSREIILTAIVTAIMAISGVLYNHRLEYGILKQRVDDIDDTQQKLVELELKGLEK